MAGFEIANPRDGLSAEGVTVSIVPDRERDIAPMLRKHNSPPTADVKKRQRKELTAPHFLHNTFADRSAQVFAAESKAFLDSRMQELELIA
jgi:hypothetical protein